MMVPSIESRLDMNESVFMGEPIAPQLFKSNQSACRDYLSVHGIYYRRIEAYNSSNLSLIICLNSIRY